MSQIFPATDFDLLAIILGLPVLSAFICGVFGKRLGKEAVSLMGLASLFASFGFVLFAYFMLQSGPPDALFSYRAWHWFTVSGQGPSEMDLRAIYLNVGFRFDSLSGLLALLVTGVAVTIAVHATGSMKVQDTYERFMSYLSALVASLLVVLFAQNLVVLLLGWQLVALFCSLLLALNTEDKQAAQGARVMGILQRLGDVSLILVCGFFAYHMGAVDFDGINLARPALVSGIKVWPVGDSVPIASLLPAVIGDELRAPRYISAATVAGLGVVIAALTRGAQIGVHTFALPSARASARALAAIYPVAFAVCSVYLLLRLAPVLVLSPAIMATVAILGALTVVLAALFLLAEKDIKRALVASNMASIGFAFVGVGVGAFVDATFWIVASCLAGSCLFLCLGSMVQANEARLATEGGATSEFTQLSGVWLLMPRTKLAFLAAVLALVGTPLTGGFASLCGILQSAKHSRIVGPDEIPVFGMQLSIPGFVYGDGLSWFVFALTAVGYALFVAGVLRLFFSLNLKDAASWQESPQKTQSVAQHLDRAWQFSIPVSILATLPVVLFALHAPPLAKLTGADGFSTFQSWLLSSFLLAKKNTASVDVTSYTSGLFAFYLVLFSLAAFVSLRLFAVQKKQAEPSAAASFLRGGAGFDWLYRETVLGAIDSLSEICIWAERWLIDGLFIRLPAFLTLVVSASLRLLQNQKEKVHFFFMFAGVVWVAYLVLIPRVDYVTLGDSASGEYQIEATPGWGYRYLWDVDGDRAQAWDTEEATDERRATLSLKRNEERIVRLQVRNALGLTRSTQITLYRPSFDDSVTMIDVTPDGLKSRRPLSAEEMQQVEQVQMGKQPEPANEPPTSGDIGEGN